MKWRLGQFAGINVFVHWSFWLVPALVLVNALAAGQALAGALQSVGLILAVFACVVLHEYGHAMAARAFGVGTRDITLYPIGGVARLDRIPRNPLQELIIALAGPAVNVAIVSLLAMVLGFSSLSIDPTQLRDSFLVQLASVNLALAVFNLVPAFPMDGGRVLRALLAIRLPYVQATLIAASIGRMIAVLMGIMGLFFSPSLVLVAVFIFMAAGAEARQVQLESLGYRGPGRAAGVSIGPRYDDGASGASDGIVWISDVRTGGGNVRVIRFRL